MVEYLYISLPHGFPFMATDQEGSPTVSPHRPRVQRPDRTQVDPDPPSIDELIPDDHPARLVWDLVEPLDAAPLYERIRAVEGRAGRPPIDPRILVALWVYATIEGVSHGRRLARLCARDDAFKWLRGGVSVNYHTLCDFRTAHAGWLQEQVTAIVAVLLQEELIDLHCVAQDGMRVRASAGSGSFKRSAKLEELLERAQQQWDRLQQEFEHPSPELSARQRAAKERAARERRERLERAKQECQKVAEARERRKKGDGVNARASRTDPEARLTKMADGGTRPAYNVQLSQTLDTLVIVGVDVINLGDAGQLDPMVEQIQQRHGQAPKEQCADGGFSTKEDVDKLTARGVLVFTPVKEVNKKRAKGEDPYAPRQGDSPAVAAWRARMGTAEAQEKYKQRAKCEWANAQFRNRGLGQFAVRGLEKVKAVVLWHVLAQNLLRMVALRAQRELAVE